MSVNGGVSSTVVTPAPPAVSPITNNSGSPTVDWYRFFGAPFFPYLGSRSLRIQDGAWFGSVALVAGVATVNTNQVMAGTRIFLTSQADGGTPGFLRVSSRVSGTSFTITSSSNADTSTVAWIMVEQV